MFHAPWGLASLLRVDTEKINLLEKIGEWKNLQLRGITQSFAMFSFLLADKEIQGDLNESFLSVVSEDAPMLAF